MNERGLHTSAEEMKELLTRYLSGETTAEGNRRVEEYLAAHPEAERELREMERVRDLLRRAVAAQSVPESLGESVRRSVLSSEQGADVRGNGVASVIEMPKSRIGTTPRWYYAAAALVLLLVGGWFALRQFGGDQPPDSPPALADAIGPVRQILQVGMTDHLNCAVAYHKGEAHAHPIEEMRKELGEEFAGLIPLIQAKVNEGTLMIAHRCSFDGREYVHLLLKGQGRLISVAITRKNLDESLLGAKGAAATASNIPIYRTAMEGYEVAGFESGEYFVFVASDLPPQNNLQVALNVAKPVSEFLRRVL